MYVCINIIKIVGYGHKIDNIMVSLVAISAEFVISHVLTNQPSYL